MNDIGVSRQIEKERERRNERKHNKIKKKKSISHFAYDSCDPITLKSWSGRSVRIDIGTATIEHIVVRVRVCSGKIRLVPSDLSCVRVRTNCIFAIYDMEFLLDSIRANVIKNELAEQQTQCYKTVISI